MTFLVIDSTDHVSGLPGLGPTVVIAKVGGAFASPAGHVFEIGSEIHGPGFGRGWYKIQPNPADYDTPGPLLLQATSAGADDVDEKWDVTGLIQPANDRVTLALISLKTMIINAAIGFSNSNAVISLEDQPYTAPSPPCCWISPTDFGVDQADDAGGGRYLTLGAMGFTIRVIVRRSSDIEGQDVNWLTNPTRGGYPIVYKLVNALQEEFLLAIDGSLLSTTGLKLMSISKPYRYGKDPMMAVVAIQFSTHILLDLAVPDP
jgi:hypothetical protein